jgi:antitoxin HicB
MDRSSSTGTEKDLGYFMALPYVVEVTYDPESESPWFAMVPDLPGCMTWAESFEELGPMIEDAKRGYIEVSLMHGDHIPEPLEDSLGA